MTSSTNNSSDPLTNHSAAADNAVKMAVYGVLIPVITPVGLFLNLCSFIVLNQPPMRSSLNLYLAALSFFDGLLLFFSLISLPAIAYCESSPLEAPASGDQPNLTTYGHWCSFLYSTAGLTYPLGCVAHSGSVWTMVAITVDRFIAIRWPLHARKWLTTNRARFFIVLTAVWSVMYNLPVFFELHRDDSGILTATPLRNKDEYIIYYKGYCYLIFMFACPAMVSIVLNIFVTKSVRQAYKVRRRLSGREEKERRCTLTAILVVGAFLTLNVLTLVNNFMEALCQTCTYANLVYLGNLMVVWNSVANFIIYCALSIRFRRMFCKLFCNRCYKPEKSDTFQRSSGHFGSSRQQNCHSRHLCNSNAVHNQAAGTSTSGTSSLYKQTPQQLQRQTAGSSTTSLLRQMQQQSVHSHAVGSCTSSLCKKMPQNFNKHETSTSASSLLKKSQKTRKQLASNPKINSSWRLDLGQKKLTDCLQVENCACEVAKQAETLQHARRPLLLGPNLNTMTSPVYKMHLEPTCHATNNLRSNGYKLTAVKISSRSLNTPLSELTEPLIKVERKGHSLNEADAENWWPRNGDGWIDEKVRVVTFMGS